MIFIDPWKDIDFSQPFDLPENIFAVRNSKISMPRSKEALGMYSSDKIRSVCILPQEGYRDRMATLIVQFWHSIWSISGGSTRRLTDPGKMVPEYVIQGCQNRIFLAEENLDRSEIHIMLEEVWNAGDMSEASIVEVCKMMNKMTVDNLLATRTDLLEKVSQLYSI